MKNKEPTEICPAIALKILKVVRQGYQDGKIPQHLARSMVQGVLQHPTRGWRVAGITSRALDIVVKAGFNHVKGVRRAHVFDRAETAQLILRDNKIPEDRVFEVWRERDVTILAAGGEGAGIATNDCYLIENDEGKLFPNKNVGFSCKREREGEKLGSAWGTRKDMTLVPVAGIKSNVERKLKRLPGIAA